MLLARLSSENCLQALLWASFRRGFLLWRRPCKPTCCSVWRMVWALTSWPATSATSKAMLAALMLLLFEASFCTWHTAQGQVWTAQMGFQGLRVRRESLVLQDPMDHQGRGGCQGWKAHEAWREHEVLGDSRALRMNLPFRSVQPSALVSFPADRSRRPRTAARSLDSCSMLMPLRTDGQESHWLLDEPF